MQLWDELICFQACTPSAPDSCNSGTCQAGAWPSLGVCEQIAQADDPCSRGTGSGGDLDQPPVRCDDGLGCFRALGDEHPTCHQWGGAGQPCRPQSPMCDEGLGCVDQYGYSPPPDASPNYWSDRCVPAGAEGQTCPSTGSCDGDLVCGSSYSCYHPEDTSFWPCCTPAGGWCQPCFEDGTCQTGLHCVQNPGSVYPPCQYTYAHQGCVQYGDCTTVGAACGGDSYCTAPSPNICFEAATQCCLPYADPASHACTTQAQCGDDGLCVAAPTVTCEYGAAACCVLAAGTGEPCNGYGRCQAGLACVTQPAGTCPYGKDSCCAVAAACGPSDTCDAGLACVVAGAACPSGQTKCCLPVGGLNEACGAGQTCGVGLGCLPADVGTDTWCQNLTECCLPAGGDGQPCVPGTTPTCGMGLACVTAQAGAYSTTLGALTGSRGPTCSSGCSRAAVQIERPTVLAYPQEYPYRPIT